MLSGSTGVSRKRVEAGELAPCCVLSEQVSPADMAARIDRELTVPIFVVDLALLKLRSLENFGLYFGPPEKPRKRFPLAKNARA